LRLKQTLEQKLYGDWYDILRAWEQDGKSLTKSMVIKNKVEERIRTFNGIPDNCRGITWQIISSCKYIRSAHDEQLYYALLERPSEYETIIEKDINRSFPTSDFHHRMKKDNRISALYNVLKVYSNWDTSFGYCQGMNFIVGMLLMYMDQESAFWMLVVIMQSNKMVGLYQKGPLLPYVINHFEREFKMLYPALYTHFEEQNVHAVMYLTEWFTTMFVYNLPIETVAYIWDVFFFGVGFQTLFQVGLAILKIFQGTLLQQGMEDILSTLKKKLRLLSRREIIQVAQKIQLSKPTLNFFDSLDVKCQKNDEYSCRLQCTINLQV